MIFQKHRMSNLNVAAKNMNGAFEFEKRHIEHKCHL